MKTTQVRIDKWLWAARFFKMRSLATHAAKAGHILINGIRCKPSKLVNMNAELCIQKEQEQFTVIVIGLADKRASASIAQKLYQETPESIKQRAIVGEQQRFKALTAPAPDKRPDKRERRKINQFKQRF